MDKLINDLEYGDVYRKYFDMYPNYGYGSWFTQWGYNDEMGPYNSFGNGSAMRVSPVGWIADDLTIVLEEAKRSAEVTHNHEEGIKGAQATAAAVFLAKEGQSTQAIKTYIEEHFDYDLSTSVQEIRKDYTFDVTCQGTVPPAIICALEAEDFEDAIRNAISLGGDADTLACITGAIAEAKFGIPEDFKDKVFGYLNEDLFNTVDEFYCKFVLES
jgi:ADP-ribosylglycohydrolase